MTTEASASRKQALVDVVAGLPLRFFTQDGTYPTVYWASVAGLSVVGVKSSGLDLVNVTRLDLLSVSTSGYVYDPTLERVYVHTPYQRARVVQAMVRFAIALHAVDLDEGFNRESRLIGIPKVETVVSSFFGGPTRTGNGSLEIVNTDQLFDLHPGLNFDAGSAALYFGTDVLK